MIHLPGKSVTLYSDYENKTLNSKDEILNETGKLTWYPSGSVGSTVISVAQRLE